VLDYTTRYAAVHPAEVKLPKRSGPPVAHAAYYSMFDDLGNSVQGRTVTLSGAVTNLTRRLKRMPKRGKAY